MGIATVATAMTQCSFGAAPGTLNVLPTNRIVAGGLPLAAITDSAPLVNILPFGMCLSLANPMVAAATAAALGVLTPMPCIPVTVGPWVPGSPTVIAGSAPAVTNSSICMCAYGGVIKINAPGQFTVQVP
jgi:hypothetical protein